MNANLEQENQRLLDRIEQALMTLSKKGRSFTKGDLQLQIKQAQDILKYALDDVEF